MTSPHPRRRFSRNLIPGLASVVLGATLFVPAANAQETEESSCAASGSEYQERSESAALELAAECNAQVLIRDASNYTTRSFAQPDGTVASEFYAVPQWVPDEAGEWIEADPSIEVAADGTPRTVATVSDLTFAAAGETAFVTATNPHGESVSLAWDEPLPQPIVEGSTVTYPEVLPDVDLEVYAGVADFSYALVVKTPEAATDASLDRLEIGMTADGLEVAHDEVTDTAALTDADGEPAFSVASPWMWDSSGSDVEEPELAAPMELEIDTDSLAVIPDQEVLADPEAEFPIYIDPQFTDSSIGWENAWSQGTGVTCGNNDMCAGRQTWQYDGAYGYWRTGMQFNGLQALAKRDVQQATVWLTQTHTGDAGGPNQTVRLYAMDYFDTGSNISWNAFNNLLYGLVATDSVPTSNDNSGESDQTITWADGRTATRIQNLVNGGANTASFAVISGANTDQEDNQNYWRKLDPDSAKLTVWHAPLKPTELRTNGATCSTSAPGPTINTLTPTLTATAPAALTSNNVLKFNVYPRDGVPDNHLQKIEVNDVADGQVATVTVSAGVLERGKTYRWNSRAWDADSSSERHGDFTAYCYFTVNSTPTVPTGLSTGSPTLGCGTQTSPVRVTTRSPNLYSIPGDPDGGDVDALYQLYSGAGTLIKTWPVTVKSGLTATTTINSGDIPSDGLYKWRVRTEDAFASSGWSGYCWATVDTTAPAPPDVVQITANPLPGGTAEFKLVGGSDVKSFEYSFNSGTKKTVSATAGQAALPITLPTSGSIDHSLQVWARDFSIGGSGNTSSSTTLLFTAAEAQPVSATAAWRFDGDGYDDASSAHLTAEAAEFAPDREGRADAAAAFIGTGSSCQIADGPVVDTTGSVTFAAWVKIDAAPDAGRVIMDVTGALRSNLSMSVSADGRWKFSTASADVAEGYSWTIAQTATGVVEYGTWAHLAGVYDAPAKRLRLYVNGELRSSVAMSGEQWKATGVFSVGCGAMSDGSTWGSITGAVDEAAVFEQALTGDQIAELMGGQGLPSALQAWYPLRGDALDHSGRGADLTAMPATPTWVQDQHGRGASALELNGSTCPTAGAVPVRTDSAFSVSAWVRLDSDHANSHPRVFTFEGDNAFSVMAKYNAASDKWNVAVTEQDVVVPNWGDGAVSVDVAAEEAWTQITVTVDPDNNAIQLFVNGDLSDTGTISLDWNPWRASEFVIGCGSLSDGTRTSQWDGAISDVRVWRGALDADEVAATHTERLSHWELGQDPAVLGYDHWGDYDLQLNGESSWVTDRWNDCWAAYGLDLTGMGHASTAEPVIRTDESFTVSAWAKIDDNNADRVVVSQITAQGESFYLSYYDELDTWRFAVRNAGSDGLTWATVDAKDPDGEGPETAVEAGRWYFLTATFDLGSGQLSLYVDGALSGRAPGPEHPWHGDGQLILGAGGNTAGERQWHMVGSIDQVYAWSGVVDQGIIDLLVGDPPEFEPDQSNPDCDGSEEPPDPGDL